MSNAARKLRAVPEHEHSADDLLGLLDSWDRHLRAERKSPNTIDAYLYGAEPYLRWAAERPELDPLDKTTLAAHTTELLDAGRAASTAKARVMGVRHFTRWLADEGEIDADPFANVKPPKVDERVIPALTDEQIVALIAACQPQGAQAKTGLASLLSRRDEAIVRLMVETGIRSSELVGILLDDVDMNAREIVIRRGKGGKGRVVGFGPQAARALDRYLRVRRLHKLADSPKLWLGGRSQGMGYESLHAMIQRRGKAAGIDDMHPHRLRHTSADRWLSRGGSETGLMAMHGWSSLAMVQRYARGNRERRAMDEAARLNLGDFA